MFEFGKDLRKLFAQARESDDLGWVELIGAELLKGEAARQSTDAGRVSCPRPFAAWMRASALWREHARRTGVGSSLERASNACADAAKAARTASDHAHAAVERAEIALLRFDLCGGLEHLAEAEAAIAGATSPTRTAACAHARLRARQARLTDKESALLDATALMDAALHDLGNAPSPARDELRMERAMLGLEAGVTRRDARLLDQAGRDLKTLVEGAAPEERPLTRARALALCGSGLRALGALANDVTAMEQGAAMFDAAADQFTPDHSPLDWVAVQVMRIDEQPPVAVLSQAQALSAGGGLVLGALARECRFAREAALAEDNGDVQRLDTLDAALRKRLAKPALSDGPLDWAADQIGLAHVALARERLTGSKPAAIGMMLVEAAATARELGVGVLAARADRLAA
ncbi:MAG: hypothetical protein V4707_00915 [Pseudomonadota bacterium]